MNITMEVKGLPDLPGGEPCGADAVAAQCDDAQEHADRAPRHHHSRPAGRRRLGHHRQLQQDITGVPVRVSRIAVQPKPGIAAALVSPVPRASVLDVYI
jgi:hypothetical protein